MAVSQFRSKKSVSGRKYVSFRKTRSCDLGSDPALTQIGKERSKVKRVKGGNLKISVLSSQFVNVAEGSKTIKLNIDSVIENPANVNYTRRNIITKGSIVKTEKGNVKITSRPGQSGTLFGKFL